MTIAELEVITSANNLTLTTEQFTLLEQYVKLLREKNQVVNLISRKDEENILAKHILHSLTLAMPSVAGFTIPKDAIVFDLGTGGGLPGIPLKIVRPDITINICDSISKKIKADEEMIVALHLENIRAIAHRTEVLSKKKWHRNKYDVIVTRAVAKLDELVLWSTELVKNGATLLALKGGDISEEIVNTQALMNVQGVTVSSLSLNGYDEFEKDEKKVVRVSFK